MSLPGVDASEYGMPVYEEGQLRCLEEDATQKTQAQNVSNISEGAELEQCLHRVLAAEARVPISTYRVQMNVEFPFEAARSIAGYLKRLGIGDFYSSPIFEARPGSMHGYDVTRHDKLNPELGGEEGFAAFSEELKRQGLGLLLDIVPNHMGVGNDSIWWQDLLENGRSSKYSEYFDIDWNPLKPALHNKLLLPILGDQYGTELENQHIQAAVIDGRPVIRYFDHIMPMAPRTLPMLFPAKDDQANGVPPALRTLLSRFAEIPGHETVDEALKGQRSAQLADVLPRLHELLRLPELAPVVEKALARINGVPGEPNSFDRLHHLLDGEPYRLASWRTSAEEINYRRFFDVNDLVGLRMENPEVFAATHCYIRSLIAAQQVTGLRIDHCDGMFNPREYLTRLQLLCLAARCCGARTAGEVARDGIERGVLDRLRGYDWSKSQGPLYTIVEKVLEPREYLPPEWPVRGTSGYDFVHLANNIFIRSENEKFFDAVYASLLGRRSEPDAIVYNCKLQVMQTALASEVHVLTNLLERIAASNRYVRDFTENILETVIRQTIAAFPVYRTYIDERGQYSERDVAFIRYAIARAKRLNPDIDASAFDFLRDTLLLKDLSPRKNGHPTAIRPEILYFALKFQQLTGPVMAKGVEDTAFYVYCRFLSCNEVGSSLKTFGISLENLHQSNAERLKYSPDSMLTTSTHDTKRSEDVRNRLNVLSEIPQDWTTTVRRWKRMNTKFKQAMPDGRIAPDANEEYLLYQTIIGAWPWRMENTAEQQSFCDRIQQYASKALSEAKVNLSWINPDPAYTQAVHKFIATILAPGPDSAKSPFVRSVQGFLPRLRLFGALNSLSQLVLKIASPGVPDFYQGSELWDLSLVDPDNRRSVDYGLRQRLLKEMIARSDAEGPSTVCREVLAELWDGRSKLWTMHRALALRKKEHELFRRGEYTAHEILDANSENAIAFSRGSSGPGSGKSVLTVVPRFACSVMRGKAEMPLGTAWGKARLLLAQRAGGRYTNVFSGEVLTVDGDGSLPLSSIFATYPVAMLLTES